MFKMLDTDNSGHITMEELKTGLQRVGANLMDSEINALMEAVSIFQDDHPTSVPIRYSFLEFIVGRPLYFTDSQLQNKP